MLTVEDELDCRPEAQEHAKPLGRENAANMFDSCYLTRLRGGDEETARHFDHYFRRLLRAQVWGKFTRQREADLVDSVMSAVLDRIFKGEPRDAASLPGYVSGVCLNLIRREMRPSFNKEGIDADRIQIQDKAKSVETALLEQEKAAAIQEVLHAMGSRDRDVLMEVFYHEIDREKVCEKYSVTPEQLRLILFRARKRFQGIWNGWKR